MQKDITPFDFKKLKDHWGAPIVARDQVEKFSGGALNRRTLANLDSRGEGPRGRFKVGRKVCYSADALCDWIAERVRTVG